MNEQEILPKGKGASVEANELSGQAKESAQKNRDAYNKMVAADNWAHEHARSERDLSARKAAATLLGKIKSPAKERASRENGRKGGRPKKQTFQDWQFDPERLDTTSVQLWTRFGTMAGLVHLQTAMQLVRRGTHFVISSQAVGEKESSD